MRENKKLKFYVNKNFRVTNLEPVALIVPFWGSNNPEFLKKYTFDTDYYTLVDDIEDSDFVLIPYRYNALVKNYLPLLDKYIKEAHQNNKPILIDGTGDIEEKINIKDSYVLRVGGYRFLKRKNEITIPYYAEDLLGSEGISFRDKIQKPVIGFTGWAYLPIKNKIKTLIKELPYRFLSIFIGKYGSFKKGIFFREKVVRILEKSDLVDSNFIIRKTYSGNVKTAEKDPEVLKKEFIDNIKDSDYSLSIRGDANSSVRFFEILSLGRIPLFVDTECNLPFKNFINYEEFCLFVDFRDIKNIDKILSDFHESISNEKFIEMQKKARTAYEEYFKAESATKFLIKELFLVLDSRRQGSK